MGWKEVAAGLGTQTTVSALKAVEGQVSKRKYKRLIATAVAQLLVLHPDIGPRKARRRARRLTGARPSKKLLRAVDGLGLKEGAEGIVAAATTAGGAGRLAEDCIAGGREDGPQGRQRGREPVEEGDAQDGREQVRRACPCP